MSVCLYRHFDKNGALLYVGITAALSARFQAHRYGSRWYSKISTVTIQRCRSRAKALELENAAIKMETPRFNRIPWRSGRTALSRRANAVIQEYGSLLRAARALRINQGVLSLLASGQRKSCSPATLKKLGLKREVMALREVPGP